ncbi:hypothetical protein B0T17DRAFT_506816 [Bombardia bombarda]|uniref:Uncharacterized protein n=1 Tax=Bombardia bombarda TaxID=252184 RepID=A0AA39XAH2_9PEZI|nr:hypothetical protein B0T17DRAFT_506816 [Bombardia bombarda]
MMRSGCRMGSRGVEKDQDEGKLRYSIMVSCECVWVMSLVPRSPISPCVFANIWSSWPMKFPDGRRAGRYLGTCIDTGSLLPRAFLSVPPTLFCCPSRFMAIYASGFVRHWSILTTPRAPNKAHNIRTNTSQWHLNLPSNPLSETQARHKSRSASSLWSLCCLHHPEPSAEISVLLRGLWFACVASNQTQPQQESPLSTHPSTRNQQWKQNHPTDADTFGSRKSLLPFFAI